VLTTLACVRSQDRTVPRRESTSLVRLRHFVVIPRHSPQRVQKNPIPSDTYFCGACVNLTSHRFAIPLNGGGSGGIEEWERHERVLGQGPSRSPEATIVVVGEASPDLWRDSRSDWRCTGSFFVTATCATLNGTNFNSTCGLICLAAQLVDDLDHVHR